MATRSHRKRSVPVFLAALVWTAGLGVLPASPVRAGSAELFSNGGFDTSIEPWFVENNHGGWQSSGGNPGGYVIINQSGEIATDPLVGQTVTGLTIGATYRASGDYSSYAPDFGNPAKPDAFRISVRVPGEAEIDDIAMLPRPAEPTVWTPFEGSFVAPAPSVDVLFRAELDGDDSSFNVDNLSLRLATAPAIETETALTGLRVLEGKQRATAKVSPAPESEAIVKFKYLKKKNGSWKLVAKKNGRWVKDGVYKAAFKQVASGGRCKLKANFVGTEAFLRSKAAAQINCKTGKPV